MAILKGPALTAKERCMSCAAMKPKRTHGVRLRMGAGCCFQNSSCCVRGYNEARRRIIA